MVPLYYRFIRLLWVGPVCSHHLELGFWSRRMVVMTETRGWAERTHCAPSSGCVGSRGVRRLGDVVTE